MAKNQQFLQALQDLTLAAAAADRAAQLTALDALIVVPGG